MEAAAATALPVMTFASGPTNSMRGAAFLSGLAEAMVVDVGGTSTDIGQLRRGFPSRRVAEALARAAAPHGVAIQARVNAETLKPDGTVQPEVGTLARFQPPVGRGVRVDTAAYQDYTVSPRYDSLLAKVITGGATLEEARRRAVRALTEFDIAGVPVNVALLQALLHAPGLGTHDVGWVDAHAADLAAASRPSRQSAAGPVRPWVPVRPAHPAGSPRPRPPRSRRARSR